MTTYACYGLRLRSEIDLPELTPVAADDSAPADIVIECGPVDPAPPNATVLPWGLWRDETSCGISVADIADYAAYDGSRIVVDRVPGAEDRDVRLFLLGTVMGAIMMQRGHLVLHGNAVRIGDSCAVVVGHSGAGKSTLAAEFARRGLDVLTDDVVPVDGEGRALTGYPRIKLWEDALERLGLEPGAFERIKTSVDKFHVPVHRSEFGPLPLRWIYSLDKHDGDRLELVEVSGMDKFDVLREHTYRKELIFDAGSTWEHLRQCADIGERARVARLLRPAATMTAVMTADAILSDIDSRLVHAIDSGDERP